MISDLRRNFAWWLDMTKQWRAVLEKQICEITWLLSQTRLVKWYNCSLARNEIGLAFTFKHHSNHLSFTPLSSGHQGAILFLKCRSSQSQWQQKKTEWSFKPFASSWWMIGSVLMLKPTMNLQEFDFWCQIPPAMSEICAKLPKSRSSWSCHGRLQHWALCLPNRKQLKLCRHLWLLFEASVTNPHGITWTKFDKSAAQRQLFVKTQFGCTSLGGRLRHEPNLWIHPKDRRWSNTACFPMVHESSWSKNSCKSLRFPNSHCIYFTWSQNWYHWQFRSTKLFLQNCQVFQKEKFFLPAPLSSSP